MATRFELVLHGTNASRLRAAADEVFDEIDRLEQQLSLYIPNSSIARINARAAVEPVRIEPIVFHLLQQALACQKATSGAFDITVAPLVRCWGFMGGTGKMPKSEDVDRARQCVGMNHVILDENDFTVRFDREGLMLDLGAIGKGYAIDRAMDILREAGVENALLHGGTSSVLAIGKPCDADAWRIVIDSPLVSTGQAKPSPEETLTTLTLKDETLSVSAVWGRTFKSNGKNFGHVIDPRSGMPVSKALLAAVVLPSGTETDALSTALLVLGPEGLDSLAKFRPNIRSLVAIPDGNRYKTIKRGL